MQSKGEHRSVVLHVFLSSPLWVCRRCSFGSGSSFGQEFIEIAARYAFLGRVWIYGRITRSLKIFIFNINMYMKNSVSESFSVQLYKIN